MSVYGNVFNIQRFSLHDGPGIRTTVFLKGCPLGCLWCHNPESQSEEPELAYYAEKCRFCGLCSPVCPQSCHQITEQAHHFDRQSCINCGECAQVCPYGALEMVGKRMSVEEVIEEAMRDKAFYASSGGGITLSGGEPLHQFAFVQELLREAKRLKLHTCVETSGFAPFSHLKALAEFTDLFLYDWKESNSEKHHEFTGVPNEIIRENLLKLDDENASIILRCPIIPGYNDNEAHFTGIARLANELRCIRAVEIMPYHALGGCKHESLGRESPMPRMPSVSKDKAMEYLGLLRPLTHVQVTGSFVQ
ncbi:MAG: glycyl-radical enzyme activating protein [Christensenellales bacterium]|jgi:glycyl-radical enzyme activating protein